MGSRRASRGRSIPLAQGAFGGDSRDRRPGIHFAFEVGCPRRRTRPERDPRVDEDLGCAEFGIDLPFLPRD